ncbi:MAG: putative O-glycosylation ligase, exosortase A system-associated, partial [Pseudomonadota bacterium]
MRDVVVMIILFGMVCATLYRPWLGVLSLANLSYLNPQAFTWGFAYSFPAYQLMFFVTAIAFTVARDRQFFPADWRIPVFYLLWVYFLLTTINAVVPYAAWPKLWEVTKIYLPFAFTLMLITDRRKLFYLIITIAGSFALVASKGGVFAIATGFSYRVWGPPATQFYENNAFAVATLIAIPLLIIWYKSAERKWERYFVMGAIPLCYCSAVSSWSRGALLTMGVLTIVLLWHSKRKWLIIPLLIGATYGAFNFLPEEWFARMYTIETYGEDESAQSRLTTWRDGWNYALDNPLLGGGFNAWLYVTRADWHSSYIEILAEHGFIAFSMWFSLLIGSMWTLTRLPRRTAGVAGMEWVPLYCY